ncbi:MAG TPA: cupin domain-containing protein, partial [Candidatus Limnocylindria bacterium]|nr:cupin domain-containing protein [Candidatus Limnocylindria bacterium]
MQILSKQPTTRASADNFVGDAWIDRLTDAQPPSRIRVNVVRFAPGARNAWHSHSDGQTLHVTEGMGRIQSRGGEVME